VRKTSSAFHTFGPLSRRYSKRLISSSNSGDFVSRFSRKSVTFLFHQVERAHSPFWLATPHFSTEDFVYNGMYIPKNTALILNCYEIHHNEDKYPDS
jgi:hypothetical protein